MSWLAKARGALAKALTQGSMRWPSQSLILFDMLSKLDLVDAAQQVGDGTESDVLMSPIRWLQRSITEAPLVVLGKDDEPVNGPLQALLDRPNPGYSMDTMLQATVYSLAMDGNAYWLKIKAETGRVLHLEWIPHTVIEPKWPSDGKSFITHYEYKPGGEVQRFLPDEVIHFRDAMDPRNIRKGLPTVRSLLRAVMSDQEADAFSLALLRNGGVPGIVISPASDTTTVTPEEATAIKERIDSGFTGENRGRTLVLAGQVNVESFGYSPKDLDLSPLRDISEERVCAALGVPAALVGFGSGLQQTKVGATMRELRQLGWWNGVIPLQKIITSELTRSLTERDQRIETDNSAVAALSESEDALANRVERLVRAGILTRGEARESLGYERTPADDVYLLPLGISPLPAGSVRPEPAAPKTKDAHTATEQRIVATSPRRRPPRQLARLANAIDQVRQASEPRFADALQTIFARLGREASRVVMELEARTAGAGGGETKQFALEELLSGLDLTQASEELRQAYAVHYLSVAEEMAGEISRAFGIEFILSDPIQQEILAAGGRRAGLIDLESQTRDAIFDALAEGREQGLAGDNLARFIRSEVEAGPWRDAATRARVIARTEGGFAANLASIQSARDIGAELMMIHDNRSGFDDEICSAMDGRVVSVQEAEQLMADEHPNGTRSATPIPALLAEEMGL